ncbi:hypothetical protein P168DRAFT_26474 [Aspergillus campestris IBT 28561]|uniref:Uncharacterized protein n=1 Tax=Aspergillus campestris (strain IBT 28561) TaxID=1392248 RepID=A0A2I1DGB9_ASPC2|nr:uncharacterized protein P168DRAFT_26474 [Aspergillus campestris IBT 28561]PKY08916.1 hypothetical protein P168DRAFT_26474 [Aspergillus campestris IBT 28561]
MTLSKKEDTPLLTTPLLFGGGTFGTGVGNLYVPRTLPNWMRQGERWTYRAPPRGLIDIAGSVLLRRWLNREWEMGRDGNGKRIEKYL